MQDYITSMVDLMRQQAAIFDLGSVLIKPVQRILKYPLLLNEILKVWPSLFEYFTAMNKETDCQRLTLNTDSNISFKHCYYSGLPLLI